MFLSKNFYVFIYIGIVTLRLNCRIDVDICQTSLVCIKLFGYINTYFLYLNEPDKACSISMLIVCVYAHINLNI